MAPADLALGGDLGGRRGDLIGGSLTFAMLQLPPTPRLIDGGVSLTSALRGSSLGLHHPIPDLRFIQLHGRLDCVWCPSLKGLLQNLKFQKSPSCGLIGLGMGEESVVPAAALESVRNTLSSVEDLRSNLLQFLSMAEPDVLADLPPLQRARAFLMLAKSASVLLSVRLRCSGIHPDDHPINKELERLSMYEDKLQRFTDWNKAPLRPSTTINYQAATRFIEHSLPDLTPEQRLSMREISRGVGSRDRFSENRGARKRRKQQLGERQSVRTAAQEFLEKAAKELLGGSDSGVKGPLQAEISDGDDEPMNLENSI